MQLLIRLILPVAVLGFGWLGYSLLSEEKAEKKRQRPKPRPLQTQVQKLELTDHQMIIPSQGVIQAQEESALTPQVSGRVMAIHPGFQDGAYFKKNDVLLELDPTDFNGQLVSARAQVARTKAALDQEEARGKQAKLNWEDLGYKDEPSDLVLRVPQFNEAKANHAAAQADVELALRNLARTTIKAPYHGRVIDRTVSYEQSVSPGTSLGTIFSTDFAEVRLPIAAIQLQHLNLPEKPGDPPLEVKLADALNDQSDARWTAEIIRTEGALNESSRELFAIARIKDPFGRENGKPPLRIGQPVLAQIPGKILKDVFVISRDVVRKLEHIYTVEAGEEKPNELKLARHVIAPIWSDSKRLVFRDASIPDGALLATSRQIYSPNQAKVEILPDPPPVADPDNPPAGTSTKTGTKKDPKKKTGGRRKT